MNIEPARKRVRFTANMEQIRKIEPVEDKSLWYSSEEYTFFRNSAIDTCVKVHGMGASKILDMSAFTTKNCTQAVMDYWSLHGQSVRGFESLANPRLGQARKRQRARCIKSVMVAQNLAREQEASGEKMDVGKFLAYVAAKESGNAKKFAAMMGVADENAVYRVEPVRPVRRRVSRVVVAASA